MAKNLRIHLKVDAETGKLTQVSDGFVKFDKRVNKATDSAARFKKQIMGMALASAGVYGINQLLGNVINTFSSLEDKQIGVAKTTNFTEEQISRLRGELDSMALSMNNFNINDLLDIAEAAGQLGIKGVDNVAKFTKEVQMIASTTDLTAQQAGVSFATMLNVLGESVDSMAKVSSTFNELSNNTTASVGDLVNYTTRLSAVGTEVGLTTAQIVGIGATLKDVGIGAELGGTAVSRTLIEMQKNVSGFASIAGSSVEDFAKSLKDEPIKALEDFLSQLGALNTGDKLDVLKGLKLDGTELTTTLLKLSGRIDILTQNIDIATKAYADGTSTLDEYLQGSKSLSGVLTRGSTAITLIAEDLGKKLKPIIVSATLNFIELSQMIINNGDAIAGLAQRVAVFYAGYKTLKYLDKPFKALMVSVNEVKLASLVSGLKTSEVVTNEARHAMSSLAVSIRSTGVALKTMALSNAPLLALIGIYETWSYLSGQVAEKEQELTRVLGLKNEELSKLTKNQALDNINKLTEQLQTYREQTQELQLQYKIARGRNHVTNEETISLASQLDTNKQNTREIQAQIGNLRSVIDGTYEVSNATNDAVLESSKYSAELAKAQQSAIGLAQALGATQLAINKQILRAKELSGELSKKQVIKLGFNLDTKSYKETLKSLDTQMKEALNSNDKDRQKKIDELTKQYSKLALSEITSSNNKTEALKSLDFQAKKTYSSSLKATKAQSKTLKDLQLKAQGLFDDIMLSDEEKKLKEIGEKVKIIYDGLGTNAGEKAFKKLTENAKDATDSISDMLQKAFNIKNDSIFANLFDNAIGSLDSVGDSLRSGNGVGDSVGNLITSSLDFKIPGISGVLSLLGGLLSSNVSQAEIDKATGRVDFTDDSLKNLGDIYSNALNPQLQATNDMNKHLRNMEQSFEVIAKGIVGSLGVNGFDLTGLNYNGSSSSGFLGFSSKTVDLLGTGLNVGGSLDSVDAYGYLTELIKKSSWWGLKTSSSIRTTSYKLPPDVQNAFSDVLNDGVSSIVTSAVALGFDEEKVSNALSSYQISTGYVSLKGLSQEEAEQRIESVFSEIFSGAIDGLDGAITNLVDKYANVGEDAMATLSRIAVEFEQGTYAFEQIGKTFEATANNYENWINQGYELTSLNDNNAIFELTDGGKGFGDIVTFYESVYSSTDKILDIIKFSGGSQAFNDTYTNFIDKYYTDAEKLKFQTKAMSDSFANLNLEMPKNNDAMRELILSYDVTNEAQAETYAQLLSLTDGFYNMSSAMENVTDTTSQVVKSISDLWLGELSYLDRNQKLEYANLTYDYTKSNGLDAYDAARAAAEQALKTTATKEEYRPYFDRLIRESELREKDATNTDLLEELRTVSARVLHLETTIKNTSKYA